MSNIHEALEKQKQHFHKAHDSMSFDISQIVIKAKLQSMKVVSGAKSQHTKPPPVLVDLCNPVEDGEEKDQCKQNHRRLPLSSRRITSKIVQQPEIPEIKELPFRRIVEEEKLPSGQQNHENFKNNLNTEDQVNENNQFSQNSEMSIKYLSVIEE